MKIMVIGGSARGGSETVERLRRDGHCPVAALPGCQARFSTDAPRDPGHAGRHLRAILEKAFAATGEFGAPGGVRPTIQASRPTRPRTDPSEQQHRRLQ